MNVPVTLPQAKLGEWPLFRKFKDGQNTHTFASYKSIGTGRDEVSVSVGLPIVRIYDEARQYFDNLFNESPYGLKAASLWAA